MDLKEQYFGTEIEMTGITREEAANAVGELFGTQPYYIGTYYSTWGVRDLEGKEWKFTYDGSIHTQRRNGNRYVYADSEYSTEMVSPKLEYGEMEKLQQVVRCLRSHGGKVNSSCGMHVHVDASNHTPRSLKNALTIMYSKEDILFKALQVNPAGWNNGVKKSVKMCWKISGKCLPGICPWINFVSCGMRKEEWEEDRIVTMMIPGTMR